MKTNDDIATFLKDDLLDDDGLSMPGGRIEVYHRFGGHGGQTSEWELQVPAHECNEAFLDALKFLEPLVTYQHEGSYHLFVALKEGVALSFILTLVGYVLEPSKSKRRWLVAEALKEGSKPEPQA